MTKDEMKENLLARQRAYCGALADAFGPIIIEDLSKFCRAKETTFHADARIHAVLEGRREVFLRIMDHLDLKPEEFLRKYANINLEEMKNV